MNKIDFRQGENWVKKDNDYFIGVSDLENVEEIHSCGYDKIEVIYKDGQIVYYQDVHGTWGFPVTFN